MSLTESKSTSRLVFEIFSIKIYDVMASSLTT